MRPPYLKAFLSFPILFYLESISSFSTLLLSHPLSLRGYPVWNPYLSLFGSQHFLGWILRDRKGFVVALGIPSRDPYGIEILGIPTVGNQQRIITFRCLRGTGCYCWIIFVGIHVEGVYTYSTVYVACRHESQGL